MKLITKKSWMHGKKSVHRNKSLLMAQQAIIRRYMLIIEILKQGRHPSLEDMWKHLHDHGFEIKVRTLQRDLEHLRDEMGLSIIYDAKKNGYSINFDTSRDTETLFRFMQIARTAEVLTSSVKSGRRALQHIHFEDTGTYKGTEYLSDVLFALREMRKIRIMHAPFGKEEHRTYILIPELLKEYQRRWYVFGTIEVTGERKMFGLERVHELEVLPDLFEELPGDPPGELFDRVIGVSYIQGKSEEIILSFTPEQGQYIKTLPVRRLP